MLKDQYLVERLELEVGTRARRRKRNAGSSPVAIVALAKSQIARVEGHPEVFGELTPRPGTPGALSPELDERLGRYWEEAEARVLNDVIDGGDYRLKFGPHERELRVGDGVYLPDRGWPDS